MMPSAAPRQETATHVSTSLPPTAPTPQPPRHIGFLKAILLFWCLPKRYGPHLAAASFRRAFGAHALSLVIAAAVVSLAVLWKAGSWTAGVHDFRSQVAQQILEISAASARMTWSWLPALMILCCLPLAELGIVALGTLAMPFGAGGDRASSVWKRSVKSAFWSTTVLIPASVILGAAILAFPLEPGQADGRIPWWLLGPLLAIFLVVAGLYAIITTILGVLHYAGPPDGPAFSPREPRCDDCGYLIISLPLDSRCPECGTAVRESLPGGRRRPTLWQQHEFKPRGFLELIRSHRAILRSNDFFRGLPVHSGLPSARHSWWVSWACFFACTLVILRLVWLFLPGDTVTVAGMAPRCGFLLAVPLVFQSMMMFASCLWAQFRYGIADYRVSAIVCYHASPLMWPLVLALFAAAMLIVEPIAEGLGGIPIGVVAGLSMNALHVAGAMVLLAIVAALAFWWTRVLRALHSVRFANV